MALINCKECGQTISDAAKTCPHCGAPVIKDVYCPKCGKKVPENVKFCPDCGTSIVSPSASWTDRKDKTTAALLAILLGGFGIQYFYLGKTTAGILTIVITFCSCSIWWLIMQIQGILMLTMSEEDFRAKYIDTDKTFPIF